MKQSFGDRLLQFANSVDILEENTYTKICKVIENYTKKTLEIKNIQIMIEAKIGDNGVALMQYNLDHVPNEVIINIKDQAGNMEVSHVTHLTRKYRYGLYAKISNLV